MAIDLSGRLRSPRPDQAHASATKSVTLAGHARLRAFNNTWPSQHGRGRLGARSRQTREVHSMRRTAPQSKLRLSGDRETAEIGIVSHSPRPVDSGKVIRLLQVVAAQDVAQIAESHHVCWVRGGPRSGCTVLGRRRSVTGLGRQLLRNRYQSPPSARVCQSGSRERGRRWD